MLFEKLRKCMKFTLMINVNVLVFIFYLNYQFTASI